MKKSSIDSHEVRRIHTLDLLRGYFLIVILLDHLAYFPSGLDLVTGRGLLYVSSAEGFFLISGIVLGIVRGRKLISQPFLVAAKKLWKRSIQLYLTSIVLTIVFTLLGWLFFMHSPGLKFGNAAGARGSSSPVPQPPLDTRPARDVQRAPAGA